MSRPILPSNPPVQSYTSFPSHPSNPIRPVQSYTSRPILPSNPPVQSFLPIRPSNPPVQSYKSRPIFPSNPPVQSYTSSGGELRCFLNELNTLSGEHVLVLGFLSLRRLDEEEPLEDTPFSLAIVEYLSLEVSWELFSVAFETLNFFCCCLRLKKYIAMQHNTTVTTKTKTAVPITWPIL